MSSENRRSPRFAFYASAEITELQTQTRLTARTSELSRHGCYMDMVNPLGFLPVSAVCSFKVLWAKGRDGACSFGHAT
jgi:hypothetical protein